MARTKNAKPKRKMPQRATSLVLNFGLVTVPLKVKPVIEQRKPVSGHRINPATGNRIKLKTVDAETGKECDTVTAYEYNGQSVVVENVEDLVAEKTGTISLTRVVDVAQIDPVFLAKPFVVFPDAGADHTFAVFTAALRESGKAAVGTTVLGKQTQLFVLRWSDTTNTMVGHSCVFESDIRWADVELVVEAMAQANPAPQEVAMAQQFLQTLEGDFEPDEVEDTYHPALQELIEAAASGQPVKAAAADAADEPEAPAVDLLAALSASVEAAKAEKPAKKKAPAKAAA